MPGSPPRIPVAPPHSPQRLASPPILVADKVAEKNILVRHRRLRQLLRFDQRLHRRHRLKSSLVAGIDEVGRGPLAGPVVASAVILHRLSFTVLIDDSKRLTPQAREKAYQAILLSADVGIGSATSEEVDRLGIHVACQRAMAQAFHRLPVRPHLVLIDGPWVPAEIPVPAIGIVDGDAKSLAIAAASIVAKVTRDRFMRRLHHLHPEYGFHHHKGYGTSEHLAVLKSIGPSSFHRFSFQPIRMLYE